MEGVSLFTTCKQINYTNLKENSFFVFDEKSTGPNHEIFFAMNHERSGIYEEIGSSLFFEYLVKSKYKNILFFIHGFNTQPEEAFIMTKKLNKALNDSNTYVIPLIWPCGTKTGIVRDYWDDQRSADLSGVSLARAICIIQKRCSESPLINNKSFNILCHSMGNRVFKEACHYLKTNEFRNSLPKVFDNVFLKAADILYTSLNKDNKGYCISDITKKIVVYYSQDDLALRGSKIANTRNGLFFTKRLGAIGPVLDETLPENVYSLDCDKINGEVEDPLGHTYFFYKEDEPTEVLNHIKFILFNRKFVPKRIGKIEDCFGYSEKIKTLWKKLF